MLEQGGKKLRDAKKETCAREREGHESDKAMAKRKETDI